MLGKMITDLWSLTVLSSKTRTMMLFYTHVVEHFRPPNVNEIGTILRNKHLKKIQITLL